MAGHTRTTGTGRARRTAGGRARRVREHLPAGEAAGARRVKTHTGARSVALARIARTTDPLRQLDAARDYLRSAAAKYSHSGEITDAIAALLAAGDGIYQTGSPRRS